MFRPISRCRVPAAPTLRRSPLPRSISPCRTARWKPRKFYEVQKHIVLTGHIVDHLNTVVAGGLWKKLSDEDRKIFTDVTQEAAAKATGEIKANEAKLVD